MKFKVSILNFLMLAALSFVPLHIAYSQTASILPPAKTTYLDKNGKPLAFGTVDFYIPGTTTPKMTWQDAGQTIPNTNPVVLDNAGRSIVLGDGSYRQIVRDKNGNLIWDQVTSSTGSGGGGGGGTPTVGDGDPVGIIKPWAGFIAPYQYVFAYGQELVRTSYPEAFQAITSLQSVTCSTGSATLTGVSDTSQLPIGSPIESTCLNAGATIVSKTTNTIVASFTAIISTTTNARFFPYGNGNGSTTFNLPDLRGQVIAGRDNMGGIAANELTTPYFSSTATASAIGAKGGNQSHVQTLAELAVHSHANTLTDPGHNHGGVVTGSTLDTTPGGGFNIVKSLITGNTNIATTGITINNVNAGSSSPFTIVQPTQTLNYIIKILPDSNPNSYFGVASIGGMYGVIQCGNGVTCSGNTISATSSVVLPPPTPTKLGGVYSLSCSTSNWFHSLDNTGTFGCSQPNFTDLLGSIDNSQIVNNSITNNKLSKVGAATLKGNPTNTTSDVQDFTIQGLGTATLNATNDYIPVYNAATGQILKTTPNAISSAGTLPVINDGEILANTSGSSTQPIGTTATTWFDKAFCNTVGYIVVRTTGSWVCSRSIPADVRWWGAACNGSTDDYTPITNAIAALPAGATLIFPSTVCAVKTLNGGWPIPNIFPLTKSIHISFPNGGGIFKSGVIGILFDILANNVTIDGAANPILDGAWVTTAYSNYDIAIGVNNYGGSTTQRNNITIRGLLIQNWAMGGITLARCFNCDVEAVQVNNVAYNGIMCAPCISSTIRANKVYNVWSSTGPDMPPNTPEYANHYGIMATLDLNTATIPSQQVLITSNIVGNVPAWECYDTHSGQSVTFSNNIGYGCNQGIAVVSPGTLAATDIIINNNNIQCIALGSPVYNGSAGISIGGMGIVVTGADASHPVARVAVNGNIVENCGPSVLAKTGDVGAMWFAIVYGLTVSGNVIYDSIHAGIATGYGVYGSIQGNSFTNITAGPIGTTPSMYSITNSITGVNIGNTMAQGSSYYGYNIVSQSSSINVGLSRSSAFWGATAVHTGVGTYTDLGATPP